MASTNFLTSNQCLVSIPNRKPFADAEGYTYIAEKVRDYMSDNIHWYDITLQTDADGDYISSPIRTSVRAEKIVSDRPFVPITPRLMYHFAPVISFDATDSNPIERNDPDLDSVGGVNLVQARSFVIKRNMIAPLELTSRSALGSGIYGVYLSNSQQSDKLKSSPAQAVYEIDSTNAYPLQDKEHGDSLTVASLNTNRYLDRIITSLRDEEFLDMNIVLNRIQINYIPTLFTLWNIVFYRTGDFISQEQLDNLLAEYVYNYLTSDTVLDTMTNEPVHELPINSILRSLGYDGIIAKDAHNNGWNRGCVSYDYSLADSFRGEFARY